MSRSEIQLSVPDAGPIDWAHLARATLGDEALGREVLGLFRDQADRVAAAIRDLPPETARLVHGLKGSARGIGAWGVAEAAQALENLLDDPARAPDAVASLIGEIRAAQRAIAAHLAQP